MRVRTAGQSGLWAGESTMKAAYADLEHHGRLSGDRNRWKVIMDREYNFEGWLGMGGRDWVCLPARGHRI